MLLLRRTLASLCIAALAISCGPPPTPTGGGGGGEAKVVKPLETKAKANEAIILGTDASGGSTAISLSTASATVTVDSMWVRMTQPATGGSSPVKLTAEPNTDGAVRVGFYEEVSGGLGSQWRAGVWLAAFVSSSTLNKDLTDFKFSAEAGGNVDGASASGLMTAGFLAAISGTQIDPAATMTGIINPDGTIGPVGGIPQKFQGSIEKGKKKLGYPIGMRFSVDVNTGQAVDLNKLAKDMGAEAFEITDVYGAYELMTGKKLPRPVPVDEGEMELEADVVEAYDARYTEWMQMLSQEWDRLIELANMGRLPTGLLTLAVVAQNEAEAAEKLRRQGFAPSAYTRIIDAWIYAASATATSEILELVAAGDLVGAKAKLHEFEGLTAVTEATMRQVGSMKPDTMGGHLQMMSAFQKSVAGLAAYINTGDSANYTRAFLDSLAGVPADQLASPDIADQVVQYTAPAVLSIARAVANSAAALQSMEIEAVNSVNYMCSLPNVRRLATSFQSAAAANVTYFEQLAGITDDQTRNFAIMMEPDYLTAWIAANLPKLGGFAETLKTEWGESSLAWGLMSLAAEELGYFKASTLVSKYYSLGVKSDPYTGRAAAVENEKAFMNMLQSAEKKARETARSAKVAAGSIPVQARIAYQNARILREGDVASKLQALELFWASSAYSQTAVMLARN
jgi:hypothetical protein